jgi:hypothetical protein
MFDAQNDKAKINWIIATDILAVLFYISMTVLGFVNIYYIFYLQRKLLNFIFSLMYLFGQIICILQIVQCFMFVNLDTELKKSCEVDGD